VNGEQTDWAEFVRRIQDKAEVREHAREIWDHFLRSLGQTPRPPTAEDLELIQEADHRAQDAALLADVDVQVSLDQLRRGEAVEALTAQEEAVRGVRARYSLYDELLARRNIFGPEVGAALRDALYDANERNRRRRWR
jgi:hypothetical protein